MTQPQYNNPDDYQQSQPLPGQDPPGRSQPPRPGQAAAKPMTVCGVVGLVLGIVAFILSFIPIINNFAFILGFIGLVLGIIAMVGTFRRKKRGKGLAIAATVLSVLSLCITLAMQASAGKVLDEASSSSSSSQSSDHKSGKSSHSKPAAKQGDQDMEGDLKTAHVKIVSAVRSAQDYQGSPTVMVTYEWTNNSDKNANFMTAVDAKVFQNGKSLDTATYTDAPEGYDDQSELADVQPKATATVTEGYVLQDDSTVTVEVGEFLDLGSAKITHKFDI